MDVSRRSSLQAEILSQNIQKIDSNKDRQEAAIYVFTIVTVIFLPLTAVAGIMGMNTSDIRDMDTGQWVFWAVAIPLAVVIISICLFCTGGAPNILNGIRPLWRDEQRGGHKFAGYSNFDESAPPAYRSTLPPGLGIAPPLLGTAPPLPVPMGDTYWPNMNRYQEEGLQREKSRTAVLWDNDRY